MDSKRKTEIRDLTQHEISAIIGYWRMTEDFQTISFIMDIPATEVEEIVVSYLNKKTGTQE